jgi:hypothetical protein
MSIIDDAKYFDTPVIVAETDTLRLVHTIRDSKRWKDCSDLTLERKDKNAMGEPVWLRVDSWVLSPRKFAAVLDGRKEDSVIVALNMLLTSFPVIEDE